MTRVLVCGGRGYDDVEMVNSTLDRIHEEMLQAVGLGNHAY